MQGVSQLPVPIGSIVESSHFREPVRVVQVQPFGDGFWQIYAQGVRTKQAYEGVFSEADLAQWQIQAPLMRDFQGDPEAFFLGIEAYRLHYAYLFDPLLAVNVSQIDPLPHQIEAVYHYILRQPDVRFLLADDPGAGKTIMAGLLLKELKYRGVVQRVLLVVPGHLKYQWQREMKEKFGEQFVVVDRNVMNAHWGRSVWLEHDQIITSMDYAKQPDVVATLHEAHWDLVIVDEAHKMAAYQYGSKTDKTARYRLGELLSTRTHGLLFLTATPHRGDPENFRLFLDLLRPGFFGTVESLQQSIEQRDNPLYLRRLKEDLKDFSGRPLFPPRHVFTRTFTLSDAEKELYNALTEYVEREYGRALQGENRNVAFALLMLQRRFASSIYAARQSLERRLKRLEEYLQLGIRFTEQGQGKLPYDEEELEELEEGERFKIEDELLEKLTNATTQTELQQEVNTLRHLVQLAKQAEKQGIETKLKELREVLDELQLLGRNEKLLIFTESRDTLDYLVKKLRSWGYSVTELHGGMNLDARIQAEHEFRHETQVMVSTEAGGEGINLQFCSLMVNYDIPWNPNRLEQRMGRIHRYGQTREVHIYNLVAHDTREGEVLATLLEKLERIREQMGTDRVFDVIGELLERDLRELIIDAVTNRRNWQEIVESIRALPDRELIERVQQATQEALATRHIDMQAIVGEERRARENRLVPEYVEQFFERACQHLQIGARRSHAGLWSVPNVPFELRHRSEAFKRAYGEVQGSYQRLAFRKELARASGAEFIAPGHPLLEAIGERLREASHDTRQRGATFYDPDGKLDGWLYFYSVELRDGNNRTAAQQIATVYVAQDGTSRLVPPAILWDLVPAQNPPTTIPEPDTASIGAFLMREFVMPLRDELSRTRTQLAEIKRKYGVVSLNRRIGELNDKLIEYSMRENIPEAEIANTQRRKVEAEQRLAALEQEIEREQSLSMQSPELLGVARVLPKPLSGMTPDAEVEAIGMQVAMEYERQQGRNPVDVSVQNLGYDIRSEAPDGTIRYIEVKARAQTGDIVLTPNEWIMAQRLGDEYWLYIITHASEQPQLHMIQNPASRLQPEQIREIVRYQVPQSQWQSEAQGA